MRNVGNPYGAYRAKAKEEFRRYYVDLLSRIIDELEDMNLSTQEIETVLKTTALNLDAAIRMGAAMKHEKEKSLSHTGRAAHP